MIDDEDTGNGDGETDSGESDPDTRSERLEAFVEYYRWRLAHQNDEGEEEDGGSDSESESN